MKKLILIVAVALIAVSASAQNLKFAHVNFAELVQLMPESDDARAQLAASQKEAQETYQSMADEFQSKYQDYQQKVSNMTPAIREIREKELSDIQQRINDFQQSIQQELAQLQDQLMAPIQQKAIEAVNKLAKDGGYIYVFDRNSMLYLDETQSTDLTKSARKALNIPDSRTLESLQAELQAAAAAQQ